MARHLSIAVDHEESDENDDDEYPLNNVAHTLLKITLFWSKTGEACWNVINIRLDPLPFSVCDQHFRVRQCVREQDHWFACRDYDCSGGDETASADQHRQSETQRRHEA